MRHYRLCVRIHTPRRRVGPLLDGRIYKRKQESKNTRKHPFDQESDQEKKEKKKVNTLSTKNLIKKKKKKR